MGNPTLLDVPCEFGGVSIGKETARVSIKVQRAELNIEEADEALCGKRITGRIVAKPRNELQGQGHLMDVDEEITGTFDVKRLGFNTDELSFGATFVLSSIDVSHLAKFAKRIGRLVATDSAEIPEDGPDEDEDHDEEEPAPRKRRTAAKPAEGQPVVANDAGALLPLSTLKKYGLTAKKIAAVAASVGGDTVGHLEAAMRANEWWHRDIKGLGEEWITRLQDAHLAFRNDYPVPTEESAA